jgi:hypothetical protein
MRPARLDIWAQEVLKRYGAAGNQLELGGRMTDKPILLGPLSFVESCGGMLNDSATLSGQTAGPAHSAPVWFPGLKGGSVRAILPDGRWTPAAWWVCRLLGFLLGVAQASSVHLPVPTRSVCRVELRSVTWS